MDSLKFLNIIHPILKKQSRTSMPIGMLGQQKKASLLYTFDDNFDPMCFFLFARAAFSIWSVSHEKHQFGSYEQTCCNGSNHMVSMWKTCELRIMGNGIALLLCKWEKWGTHTIRKKMEKLYWNDRGILFLSKIFDIHWAWYFGLRFVTDSFQMLNFTQIRMHLRRKDQAHSLNCTFFTEF